MNIRSAVHIVAGLISPKATVLIYVSETKMFEGDSYVNCFVEFSKSIHYLPQMRHYESKRDFFNQQHFPKLKKFVNIPEKCMHT